MSDTPYNPVPADPIHAAEEALAQAVAQRRPDSSAVAAAIDRGAAARLQDAISGGPIARATECWNHLQAALPALKSAILKEID